VESEAVTLAMTCADCGYPMMLGDGAVFCPHCGDAAEGETPADAVNDWLDKHPAPSFLPTTIHDFIVPKHPDLRIEVGGIPFESLSAAEQYVSEQSGWLEIHCYTATSTKKVVSQ